MVGELRRDLRFLRSLRVLPPRVAAFQWRAWRLGRRMGDDFALSAATRPPKLAAILGLAKGRRYVVELGTAQAWTAISLALAEAERQVVTYDPVERPQPADYLSLVPEQVRGRVQLVIASSIDGPRDSRPVELLYVDSTHAKQDTIHELEVWRPVLVDGALVVFDDFDHPEFPGVREAVEELGLAGEERNGLFVHRVSR